MYWSEQVFSAKHLVGEEESNNLDVHHSRVFLLHPTISDPEHRAGCTPIMSAPIASRYAAICREVCEHSLRTIRVLSVLGRASTSDGDRIGAIRKSAQAEPNIWSVRRKVTTWM